MSYPRIMIAGVSSGVGKTTVTMGLLAALSKKMVVQPFKVGPDYIDTAYHSYITGKKSRNLDNYLLNNETVQGLFIKNMKDAQIGVIEGVMGLYDGAGESTDVGSSASVAKVLSCPVILVVDGSGIATSVAALVKGFVDFDPDLNLKGVIVNKVNSKRHYDILKEAIETYTSVTCYGYLQKNNRGSIKSRHLGLVPSWEMEDLDLKIKLLTEDIEKNIDLDGLIEVAKNVSQDNIELFMEKSEIISEDIHIAIPYDEAFNFYYEDNLDLLKELGATLHFFSPIKDKVIPRRMDFIYFGGGFPEVFGKALEENHSMKSELLKKLQEGIPYLAECGGLMYLCEELVDMDGTSYKMLGWLQGKCVMTKGLKRFGYKGLTLGFHSILGKKGTSLKVHEFHHSEAFINHPMVYHLEKIRKGELIDQYQCGYIKGNGVAGYPHLHFYSNKDIAVNIIKAAANYSKRLREI